MSSMNKILEEMNAYSEQFGDVVTERQKGQPAGGWSDGKGTRLGAFKVDAELLKMMKSETGEDPDKMLFKRTRDAINAIPRDDLPALFGADNIPDAQDVIARNPRKAFQLFLRKAPGVLPKLAKYLRAVPSNASLVFYGIMLRVSGRDMANQIFHRYFTTDDYYEPSKRVKMKQRRRKRAAAMPSGSQTKMFPESVDSIMNAMMEDAGIIEEAKSSVYGNLKKELVSAGFSYRKMGNVDTYTMKVRNKGAEVKHLEKLLKGLGIEGYHNVERFQGGTNWHFAHTKNRNLKVTVTAYEDTPDLVVKVL